MTAPVPEAYRALIDSDRVSRNTRTALLARTTPDDPAYTPKALDDAALQTLRAVLACVLPQGENAIDLAARVDTALANGDGDGWRDAALPPDAQAYRLALAALDHASQATHGATFAALTPEQRDAMLNQAAAGELATPGFDGEQTKKWFEDARSDAVRHYVAHPATLARMGYSGIGYGGDGPTKPGFVALEPGQREPWEPEAQP